MNAACVSTDIDLSFSLSSKVVPVPEASGDKVASVFRDHFKHINCDVQTVPSGSSLAEVRLRVYFSIIIEGESANVDVFLICSFL